MPFDIANIGQQAAETGVAAGMGLLLEKHNDNRQYQQQERLSNLQLMENKRMADYNYNNQMKMWHETNYSAQMEELRKAGLNPGLVYGTGSGGGGATTNAAQGGAVSGASAPQGGGEIQALMMQKMQLGLMEAQRKNIEADTANKQADTTNKPLVGQNLQASTNSLTQGVENQKAQMELTKVQTKLNDLELSIRDQTKEFAMEQIRNVARQAEQTLGILTNEQELSTDTINDKVKLVHTELIQAGLRNKQIQAETNLTERETTAISEYLAQKWQEISIQYLHATTEQDKNNILVKQWNEALENNTTNAAGNIGIEIGTSILKAIGFGMGAKGLTEKPTPRGTVGFKP